MLYYVILDYTIRVPGCAKRHDVGALTELPDAMPSGSNEAFAGLAVATNVLVSHYCVCYIRPHYVFYGIACLTRTRLIGRIIHQARRKHVLDRWCYYFRY